MKNIKSAVLKKLAACGKAAAVKAAGASSCAGCHQPKEPEAARKLRKA